MHYVSAQNANQNGFHFNNNSNLTVAFCEGIRNAQNQLLYLSGSTSAAASNVEITNCYFDPQGVNQPLGAACPIWINWVSTSANLSNVSITGNVCVYAGLGYIEVDGIVVGGVTVAWINNCVVADNILTMSEGTTCLNGQCIQIGHVTNAVVSGNSIYVNGAWGINFEFSSTGSIVGNTLTQGNAGSGDGIGTSNSAVAAIDGNTISSFATGIYLNTGGCTVTGNYLSSCTNSIQINQTNTNATNISDNVISGGTSAIFFNTSSASHVAIRGNAISGCSYAFRFPAATTIATSSATSSGSTLHFAATTGVANGMYVFDTTTSGVIPYGTTVSSFTGTTVNLSNVVTGGGVLNADSIAFYPPMTDILIAYNKLSSLVSRPYNTLPPIGVLLLDQTGQTLQVGRTTPALPTTPLAVQFCSTRQPTRLSRRRRRTEL